MAGNGSCAMSAIGEQLWSDGFWVVQRFQRCDNSQ
jgi:hypothetical protein